MTPFSDEISYINQKQNATNVNDNHSKRGILTWILCRGLQEESNTAPLTCPPKTGPFIKLGF
jgi:hypothetical protein